MPASQAPASIAGFPNTRRPAMRPFLTTAVACALLVLAAPSRAAEPALIGMGSLSGSLSDLSSAAIVGTRFLDIKAALNAAGIADAQIPA